MAKYCPYADMYCNDIGEDELEAVQAQNIDCDGDCDCCDDAADEDE